MSSQFGKFFYFASTALSLSLAAYNAEASVIPLPVGTDLDFSDTSGTPKGPFSSVAPAGWTGGGNLIFVDSTTLPDAQAASRVYLTTYGNPTGTVTGNYVEADGNPSYENSFSREITGLIPNQKYSVSFYQGASSQTGFGIVNGQAVPTTNQWIVSLGTSGMSYCNGCGPADSFYGGNDSTYYNNDPNASIAPSTLMTVPYQGTVGWSYVTVTLTADATTDLLSFLAWGDNGNTVNLPPIAFLAGIDQPVGEGSNVPEPVSMSLFGVGIAGLGVIARRRRGKRSTSN